MNLTIKNLNIIKDETTIIKNFSVSLLAGAIVRLCGSNGSGKTSIIQALCGIGGYDDILEVSDSLEISFLSHEYALKDYENITQHLEFYASLSCSKNLPEIIRKCGFESIMNKKISHLSAGAKKKVAIARLLLKPANVWLLDEADVNLDSDNKIFLYNLISEFAANGGIIIFASHQDIKIDGAVEIYLDDFKCA